MTAGPRPAAQRLVTRALRWMFRASGSTSIRVTQREVSLRRRPLLLHSSLLSWSAQGWGTALSQLSGVFSYVTPAHPWRRLVPSAQPVP